MDGLTTISAGGEVLAILGAGSPQLGSADFLTVESGQLTVSSAY